MEASASGDGQTDRLVHPSLPVMDSRFEGRRTISSRCATNHKPGLAGGPSARAPPARVHLGESAGASAVLRTTMSRSCRRCSCRRRPTCRRCPTASRRPASSAPARSSGCRAIRLTATAGRPRMSRPDRLAWIVIGDSVAVVLGFGAIRHGDHLRASAPASPSSPWMACSGYAVCRRRVTAVRHLKATTMRFDLAVASFGAPNASALPRVEGSLPCMPRLLFRIWIFLAACGLARIAMILCAQRPLHRVLRRATRP
jgi:hypothetical protein